MVVSYMKIFFSFLEIKKKGAGKAFLFSHTIPPLAKDFGFFPEWGNEITKERRMSCPLII